MFRRKNRGLTKQTDWWEVQGRGRDEHGILLGEGDGFVGKEIDFESIEIRGNDFDHQSSDGEVTIEFQQSSMLLIHWKCSRGDILSHSNSHLTTSEIFGPERNDLLFPGMIGQGDPFLLEIFRHFQGDRVEENVDLSLEIWRWNEPMSDCEEPKRENGERLTETERTGDNIHRDLQGRRVETISFFLISPDTFREKLVDHPDRHSSSSTLHRRMKPYSGRDPRSSSDRKRKKDRIDLVLRFWRMILRTNQCQLIDRVQIGFLVIDLNERSKKIFVLSLSSSNLRSTEWSWWSSRVNWTTGENILENDRFWSSISRRRTSLSPAIRSIAGYVHRALLEFSI